MAYDIPPEVTSIKHAFELIQGNNLDDNKLMLVLRSLWVLGRRTGKIQKANEIKEKLEL